MSEERKINTKRCFNCKFRCSQDYSDDTCESEAVMRFGTSPSGKPYKIFPRCSEIVDKDQTQPCPHFREGFWFKLGKIQTKIMHYYYKKRYPELFI